MTRASRPFDHCRPPPAARARRHSSKTQINRPRPADRISSTVDRQTIVRALNARVVEQRPRNVHRRLSSLIATGGFKRRLWTIRTVLVALAIGRCETKRKVRHNDMTCANCVRTYAEFRVHGRQPSWLVVTRGPYGNRWTLRGDFSILFGSFFSFFLHTLMCNG